MIKKVIKGAKFTARSFFRPTGMSIALAESGLLPAEHFVKDMRNTALLRHKNDTFNQRPSVLVAF